MDTIPLCAVLKARHHSMKGMTMRKILLSSASVAALLTLAACNDDYAETRTDDPAAIEQTAETDASAPATGNALPADAEAAMNENAVPTDDGTDMAAGTTQPADEVADVAADDSKPADEETEVAVDATLQDDITADAEATAKANAEIQEVRQAITEAKAALESEAYDQAIDALKEAETALEDVQNLSVSGETTAATE
jgi:hypothetical protein